MTNYLINAAFPALPLKAVNVFCKFSAKKIVFLQIRYTVPLLLSRCCAFAALHSSKGTTSKLCVFFLITVGCHASLLPVSLLIVNDAPVVRGTYCHWYWERLQHNEREGRSGTVIPYQICTPYFRNLLKQL